MKKVMLALAAILMFGTYTVSAQNAFGAKVTPMLSWAKVKNNGTLTYTGGGVVPSIGFGPSFKHYFGENFNVDAGVLFTWQTSRFTQNILTVPSFTYEPRLRYVQIPIMFEAGFTIADNLKGLIDFGVAPAVELESVANVYLGEDHKATPLVQDYDFKGSAVNVYLSAGAGVNYDLTNELALSAIVLYNNGVIDSWYDDDAATYLPEVKFYNHYVSLNIGVHIKF